jgi:hypothetical protein
MVRVVGFAQRVTAGFWRLFVIVVAVGDRNDRLNAAWGIGQLMHVSAAVKRHPLRGVSLFFG